MNQNGNLFLLYKVGNTIGNANGNANGNAMLLKEIIYNPNHIDNILK